MKFSELDKDKTSKSEEKVLKYWKENDIFKKRIKNIEGNKNYVFYDGSI